MLTRSLALVVIFANVVSAQSAPPRPSRSSAAYAQTLWREVSTYLTQAAIETPDSVFRFKPAPDVRTFGEMLDHVAASQNGYCRMAFGERPTGGGNGTGASSKPEIIEALRASNALCERAYAQTDSALARPAYEGDKRSRLYQLFENATHDNEHYGNIVTYLRINHLVPPSSQPAATKP